MTEKNAFTTFTLGIHLLDYCLSYLIAVWSSIQLAVWWLFLLPSSLVELHRFIAFADIYKIQCHPFEAYWLPLVAQYTL